MGMEQIQQALAKVGGAAQTGLDAVAPQVQAQQMPAIGGVQLPNQQPNPMARFLPLIGAAGGALSSPVQEGWRGSIGRGLLGYGAGVGGQEQSRQEMAQRYMQTQLMAQQQQQMTQHQQAMEAAAIERNKISADRAAEQAKRDTLSADQAAARETRLAAKGGRGGGKTSDETKGLRLGITGFMNDYRAANKPPTGEAALLNPSYKALTPSEWAQTPAGQDALGIRAAEAGKAPSEFSKSLHLAQPAPPPKYEPQTAQGQAESIFNEYKQKDAGGESFDLQEVYGRLVPLVGEDEALNIVRNFGKQGK